MNLSYRAVGNRCAVELDSLELPLSHDEILKRLQEEGFNLIHVDIISLARRCVVTSSYERGAPLFKAPTVMDCSSFIKWLYGQRGIWLPRRSIQQREMGEKVEMKSMIAGDVIFTTGIKNYHFTDPADGVGHVGIYAGEGTVVQAVNKKFNIKESSLERFLSDCEFRGVRRYIPQGKVVLTFETPLRREIETSDDLRWIIFQSLPY